MKSIVVNLFFFIIIFMFYGCNKENSIQTAMVEYDGIVLYSNDDGPDLINSAGILAIHFFMMGLCLQI